MELKKQSSVITPVTHKRTDNGYHSKDSKDEFASATKIRDMIANDEDISQFVPYSYDGCPHHKLDALTDIFKYILLSRGSDAFCGIVDMEPGLDNRFLKNLDKGTITEIIDSVKTKRYTRTRLQRIVLNVILGITQDTPKPEYIRILGMTEKGKEVLAKMKKTAEYPIINKVADFKEDSIKTEIHATDIAALCTKSSFGRDYTTSPVVI